MSSATDNPFHKAYWLGRFDARLGALLRIALGTLVVADLADRLRDFHAFYTTAGMIVPPEARPPRLPLWSVFDAVASPGATLAIFLAGVVAAVAFTLGYRARAATVALWVLMTSLGTRSPYVSDGGDTVVQALLFWCMFADVSAQYSLDVALGRRPRRDTVPAGPMRILQTQVAVIYLFTFLAKNGPTWWSGHAVELAITSSDWGRGLGPILSQHPRFCALLTYATLATEAAFPLLVLSPWRPGVTRAAAIAAGLALHGGIFLTMRVGIFSQVMPATYLLFLQPTWIDRATSRLRSLLPPRASSLFSSPSACSPSSSPSPSSQSRSRRDVTLVVLLGAQLALIVTEQIARAAPFSLPAPLAWELALVGQRQNWAMFAPDAPKIDVTWEAPGVLAGGTSVELTTTVARHLNDRSGFRYSRWHRLRNMMIRQPPELMHAVGRYFCRRWNGEIPGPPLQRFELYARIEPRFPPAPARTEVALRQSCAAAAPAPPAPPR